MSDKRIKNWEMLKSTLFDGIQHIFKDEKLNYEEDVIWKLARHSLDFIVRILNDANDLKYDDAIHKENISLALVLESENRLAICQLLPYRELLDISVVYNSKELPEIKTWCGLRIPTDNLTKSNYKLKTKSKDFQSRKSAMYTQRPNHCSYVNPFMSNSMQITTMYGHSKPLLNPISSQVSTYASLYPPQRVPLSTMTQQLLQQPTMSTSASAQNVPSQLINNYRHDLQMEQQQLVFRPRFNVTNKKMNSNNINKRKMM